MAEIGLGVVEEELDPGGDAGLVRRRLGVATEFGQPRSGGVDPADRHPVGDLGRLDDQGYLYLDGRRTDLIISGGVNVYPLEVEQILGEHPLVDDIAVFATPDDDWGQRVCAAVVGSISEDELAAYARERLAPPKRPKTWTFRTELPRTLTGKVRRDELSGDQGPSFTGLRAVVVERRRH